jgi:hypothetical protein
MATAEYVPGEPSSMDYYFGHMTRSRGNSEVIESVQRYLASWPKERILGIQAIDAGWAPFDANQKPIQVDNALTVRCIRDELHHQCVALREAGMAIRPEFLELSNFFRIASQMLEHFRRPPLQARTQFVPSDRDLFVT